MLKSRKFRSRNKSFLLSCCGAESIRGVCFMTLMLGAVVSVASAQQVSLSLPAGSTTPGGSLTLNLALTNSGGSQPAGVQWTLSYPSADIASVSVAAGSAATAAAKTVACNGAAGSMVCVVSGLNATPIASGSVASVTFHIASSPTDTSVPVQVAAPAAAAGDGSSVAAAGTGSTITVNKAATLALSSLSCSPANIATPGSATCTVALNGNASSSGFPVSLKSNNANLTVPSAITVPASQSSVGFTAKAASVSSTQSAVLTATAAGASKTFTATLSPTGPAPTLISSIACTPSSVYSGGSSSCKVTLTKAAASATSIKLISNSKLFTVPASVSIASGASSAGFTAKAATIATKQTAILTATGPNNSQTFTETLLSGSAQTGGSVSIWASNAVPGTVNDPDSNSLEIGVKFTSDVAGNVTGVRFYKGSQNSGTHVGHLWSSNGTLLATVTFANETASGWQQANFSQPVAIQANTTYVVSYYCPRGHYSSDNWFFQNSAVNHVPLHALQNTSSHSNGVYRYGASSFPNQSWDASNYWVDLVFTPAP